MVAVQNGKLTLTLPPGEVLALTDTATRRYFYTTDLVDQTQFNTGAN